MSSDLRRAALAFAAKGIYVLPCAPGTKRPMISRGLRGASIDPEQINQFWLTHPTANVAIRTGEISGLVVLDTDGDEGAESLFGLEQEHGALPVTTSAKRSLSSSVRRFMSGI